MDKKSKQKETPYDNFFEPIKRTAATSADISIETELVNPEVELGQFSVGLENIDTFAINHDKVPLGLEVQYDYETSEVVPKINIELSDTDVKERDPKDLVDAALEEYERSLREDRKKKKES